MYTKMDIPVLGFQKYWAQESEWHAVTNKYTEAASVVQQVYKVLSDTDPCQMYQLKWDKWTTVVNSAKENNKFLQSCR
jgi:hypothetical protein